MFGLFDTLCDALGDIKDAVSEKLEDKIESLGEKIVQKVEGDSAEHTMKDKFFGKMRKIGIADDEIERRWQSLCCESSERHEALVQRMQTNRESLQKRLTSSHSRVQASLERSGTSIGTLRERFDATRGRVVGVPNAEGVKKGPPENGSPSAGSETETTHDVPKMVLDERNVDEELASLVGIGPVKTEISKLRDYVAYQVELKRRGKTLSGVSNHCVFTGNPGTGKTTVARIIARIYYEAGVIKENKIKEVDRSGLVAEYIGHTAVKTNKVIDEALDGVLFIDEAYALSGGGEKDFGKEAVDTLLKRMEDDRDRLVVIVAGYTKEMQQFIEMNPGLKSRFTRYIDFPDYSADELVEIFRRLLSKEGFVCGDDVIEAFHQRMVVETANKQRDFSNARFVRNLFEEMKRNLAVRVSGGLKEMSDRELQTVLVSDLPE